MRMRLWLEIVYDSQGVPTDERRLHRMKVTGARNDRIPIELRQRRHSHSQGRARGRVRAV
jgi:hypothetical protein